MPDREPDFRSGARTPGRTLSRSSLLRSGILIGCASVTGGVVLAGLPQGAASKPSEKQDAEILNFVLILEALQFAFYDDAVNGGKLSGELREFAEEVGGQEREHGDFVRQALGSAVRETPDFDFGDATRTPEAFGRTARQLEDLGVAAYNSQAPNLTKASLAAAAQIVSVEARHAAWIRDLTGKNPAPFASEPRMSAQDVTETLNRTGFIK